jgi:hypothetical protein
MKKQICTLVLCSAVLGFGSAEAAYVTVDDATGNGSMATALNLDTKFDQNFDANIGNPFTNISTSFFHASANATTGTTGRDWYSFTTSQANQQAYFDIDNGMWDLDSWVNLYNSAGALIGASDDGGVNDPGSVHGYDSFLSAVLTNPGLYYLSVGRYYDSDLNPGQDYTLHVSLENHVNPSNVPVPAAVWLFGSGIAGLMGARRKKMLVAPAIA